MKPIIFARIADMKFYKGITDTDKPVNGGSYVKDTNYAHECYNFDPVILEDKKEYCLGFTQLLGGKDPQLHIEHIVGCKGMKDGHNNIWFAGSNTYNMDEINYVNKMIESIENYNGENMI